MDRGRRVASPGARGSLPRRTPRLDVRSLSISHDVRSLSGVRSRAPARTTLAPYQSLMSLSSSIGSSRDPIELIDVGMLRRRRGRDGDSF